MAPLKWADIKWRTDTDGDKLGTIPGILEADLRIRYWNKGSAGMPARSYSVHFGSVHFGPNQNRRCGLDTVEALCLLNHLITEKGNHHE
jgi:hypothetical protein